MPADPRIKNAFKPVVGAIRPAEELQRMIRLKATISEDGTIPPSATRMNTPLQTYTFSVPGNQAVVTNAAQEIIVVQRSRIIRYDVYVKTAPSPGNLIMQFTKNNALLKQITINAGATANTLPGQSAGTAFILDPGDIIRINVTQIGGGTNPGIWLTANLTVQADIVG